MLPPRTGVPVSLARVARPASSTVVISLVAAAIGGFGLLLSLLMGLSPPSGDKSGLGLGLFGASFMGGGPVILGLAIAGAQEKLPIPRGVAWMAGAGVSLASAVLLMAALAVDDGAVAAAGSGVLCCGLPIVGLLGAGGWSLFRGFRSMEADVERAAEADLVALLLERRAAGFDELAAAVGVHPDRIEPLLTRIQRRTGGELNLPARAWIGPHLAGSGRTQLLGIIEARGKVTLPELSAELGLPESVVRAWVHELAGAGQFQGSVHWPRVWSESAARLSGGACPNCGAGMQPAGRDRLECPACGTESFRG